VNIYSLLYNSRYFGRTCLPAHTPEPRAPLGTIAAAPGLVAAAWLLLAHCHRRGWLPLPPLQAFHRGSITAAGSWRSTAVQCSTLSSSDAAVELILHQQAVGFHVSQCTRQKVFLDLNKNLLASDRPKLWVIVALWLWKEKGGSSLRSCECLYATSNKWGGVGFRPCFHLCAENDMRASMFSVRDAFVFCWF
jgi:hypothetical protein